MSKPRDIRVLKGGLTFGSRIYKAGELLEPQHCSPTVRAYASGEKKFFTGERVVEYVEVEVEVEPETKPTTTTDAEITDPEPTEEEVLEVDGGVVDEKGEVTADAPEPEPEVAPTELENDPVSGSDDSDLVDFILTMVEEGHTKTEVVETLAEGDEYTQKQVRAEFDRLMGEGRILETEERGKYRVAE